MSIPRFPRFRRVLAGCVVLTLASGSVQAACVVSSRTPRIHNQQPITPSGLLKSYPRGGPDLRGAVGQFAIDQPDDIAKLLVYSTRATDRQLRAIAEGLRSVVDSCQKEFPMVADDITRVALRSGFSRFTAYYLEAAAGNDAPATAAPAPARSGGPQFPIPIPSDTHPDLNQNLLADPFAPP